MKLVGVEDVPIHELYFENVNITAKNGFEAENVKDITFRNTKLNVQGKPFTLKNAENILLDGVAVK